MLLLIQVQDKVSKKKLHISELKKRGIATKHLFFFVMNMLYDAKYIKSWENNNTVMQR